MATTCAYENDKDRKQHARAIQMLADDLNIPEAEIKILYEPTLRNFKERSRISDYLVILVSRNVKYMIKGAISSETS